jgi:hypothetical protein
MDSREEDLPWPPPTESAVALLNLLSPDFQPSSNRYLFNPALADGGRGRGVGVASSFVASLPLNPDNRSTSHMRLESMHKKLSQILGARSINQEYQRVPHQAPFAPPYFQVQHQGLFPQQQHSVGMIRPLQNIDSGHVPHASSDDVCTLFANKCAIPSNSGGKMVLPPIGVFWDIENCSVSKGGDK